MRIFVAVILVLVGCTKPNPNYCPDDDPACPDRPCSASDDSCVCKLPPGVCVECTADDLRNCAGATPTCGDDNRCRACRANDECSSGACLENGACAEPSRLIFAAPNGSATPGCGTTPGVNECSLAQAVLEVSGMRNIVRLAPGNYMVTGADGLDLNGRSATVIARDATITHASTGPIMTARNSGALKLVGGTLRGPNNSDGLRCNTGGSLSVHEVTIENMTQTGIEADACEMIVSRSTIRGNLDGGIRMLNTARTVTITNNFVYRNGQVGVSQIGGMALRVTPMSKVEFNTVVDNVVAASDGLAGGIHCNGGPYDGANNLVYRNRGGLDDMVQTIGDCTFVRSYVLFAAASQNDVGFEAPNNPTNPSYRLTEMSPAPIIRDALDCAAGTDFDGERRPEAAGGKCDYGADEFHDAP